MEPPPLCLGLSGGGWKTVNPVEPAPTQNKIREQEEQKKRDREARKTTIGSNEHRNKHFGEWMQDQADARNLCTVEFYPDGMGIRLEKRQEGYSWEGRESGPVLVGERTEKGDSRQLVGRCGKRGTVKGFSKKSAARMLDLVWKLDKKQLPVMITPTYPKAWEKFTPKKVKANLDEFFRRLEKRYPRMAAIWKLEFQERGAPHFHILVWGCKPWHQWVAVTWWKICGKVSKDHRRAGTRVEVLRSYRGTLAYCGKSYMAKGTVPPQDGQNWGRLWGVRRKARLPLAECVREVFHARVGVHLARLMRRFQKANGRRIKYRGRVCWMLSENQSRWVDALQWAYGMWCAEPSGHRLARFEVPF